MRIQCTACKQTIALGVNNCAFSDHDGGYKHYPSCPGGSSTGYGQPTPGALDLADGVASAMAAARGKTFDGAVSATGAPAADAQSFLRHSQSLGPQDPHTGLRRGQDLTDAVAEALLSERAHVAGARQ
jgi:hypothetical protein